MGISASAGQVCVCVCAAQWEMAHRSVEQLFESPVCRWRTERTQGHQRLGPVCGPQDEPVQQLQRPHPPRDLCPSRRQRSPCDPALARGGLSKSLSLLLSVLIFCLCPLPLSVLVVHDLQSVSRVALLRVNRCSLSLPSSLCLATSIGLPR